MAERSRSSTYDYVKASAAIENIPTVVLEDLKKYFADDIGSVRRSDQIKKIMDLVDVLERRHVIAENNIEPLLKIAKECRNAKLYDAILSYPQPAAIQIAIQSQNHYREQRLAEDLQNHMQINVNNQTANHQCNPDKQQHSLSLAAPLSKEKRAAVYKKIAQSIGNYWRRLGRELQLTEGSMDEIELKFPRELPSRIYAILRNFEEDEANNPATHFITLCRALDECQRKDIRRQIEQILMY